jgi:hypothetical protein
MEKWTRKDKESLGALGNYPIECARVVGTPDCDDDQRDAEGRCCFLRLSQLGLLVFLSRGEDGKACRTRDRLLEELQTLSGQGRLRDGNPGHVASRLRQARHESLRLHGAADHDDGDCLRRVLRRVDCLVADGDDHIRSELDQLPS